MVFPKSDYDAWLLLYFSLLVIAAWKARKVLFVSKDRRPGSGTPYMIPFLRRYQVCVSSQKLVEELTNASIHQLSLREALWEVNIPLALQSDLMVLMTRTQRAFPEQTIDGLKLDGMDRDGSLSQKVFRHHARLHLPNLQPLLQKRLEEAWTRELQSQNVKDGQYLLGSVGAEMNGSF
ncbi:MAG: hypothetical protein Q9165_002670 [Trypethelium subeluteriae]